MADTPIPPVTREFCGPNCTFDPLTHFFVKLRFLIILILAEFGQPPDGEVSLTDAANGVCEPSPSLTTFLIARLLSTRYKDKKPQVALQTG